MPTAPGARGPLLHASPNEYIVLGDNRPGSRDSREFGPVPRRRLKPEVRQQILRRRIPRRVALSMAFESEAVDLSWLETLHRQRGEPVPRRSS